jgi:hypothetical protein
MNKSKTLVLFVFHEINDRVNNFFKNCIFYDDNVDFVVICNYDDIPHKIHLPNYVKIIHRCNIGFDFGGWSEALFTGDLYKNYDYFIFVNSSVIGPFLPSYYKRKWTDIYIDGLKNNVKLFGSTINTENQPLTRSHVQSYIFCMEKTTLEYLIACNIFKPFYNEKNLREIVDNYEIGMSRKIIEKGWNIGSLLDYYKDIDFTFEKKSPTDYNINYLNDMMYSNYRNVYWNEYELVFIKGNRITDININKIRQNNSI